MNRFFKTIFVFIVFSSLWNCTPEESCPNCPCIESIEPSTASPGDTITIKGRNFDRFNDTTNIGTVTIGGIKADFTGISSETAIQVEVPEDAEVGEVIVCALNPNSSKSNELCSNFEDSELGCGNSTLEISESTFQIDTTGWRSLSNLQNLFQACQINNGNFIVVNNSNGRVIEVNSTLKIVNEFYLKIDSSVINVNALVSTKDDGFVVLSNGNKIAKYNSNSAIPKWEHPIPLSEGFNDLISLRDNGFLLTKNHLIPGAIHGGGDRSTMFLLNEIGQRDKEINIIGSAPDCSSHRLYKILESEEYFHILFSTTKTTPTFPLPCGEYMFNFKKENISANETIKLLQQTVENLSQNNYTTEYKLFENSIIGLAKVSLSSDESTVKRYDYTGNILSSESYFFPNSQDKFLEVSINQSCYLVGSSSQIASSNPTDLRNPADFIILDVLPTQDNRFLLLTMKKPIGFDESGFDKSTITDFGIQLLYSDCELSNL